jgi:lactoylglutathione lyase
MKGLAFALDPDGYWIEIIKRPEGTGIHGFSFGQTMLRISDPVKSLKFY